MANIKRVSPSEAMRLMGEEGYVYLDVRSEPEFSAGHPAGAHNLPLMEAGARGLTPNPHFLTVAEAVFARETKIIVGCRSGQRSLRAAEMLIASGFVEVIDQRAGYDGARDAFGQVIEEGWSNVGLPCAQEAPGSSHAALRAKAGR